MADASGKTTLTPEYVVKYKNSKECVTCFEAFINAFAATSSGPSYSVSSFGSTTESLGYDENAKVIPDLDSQNIVSTPGYSTAALTVNDGSVNDLVFCTTVEDIYEGSEDIQMPLLTVKQTSFGLDHQNVPVPDGRFVSGTLNVNGTTTMTLSNLEGGTYYNVYCVVQNYLTSATKPLYSSVEVHSMLTSGEKPDDDDDGDESPCIDCDEEEAATVLGACFLYLLLLIS